MIINNNLLLNITYITMKQNQYEFRYNLNNNFLSKIRKCQISFLWTFYCDFFVSERGFHIIILRIYLKYSLGYRKEFC